MHSIATQLKDLVSSLILGAVIALIFQTYQLALTRTQFKRWFVFICDACFWLIAVIVVFTGLLFTNGGEFRLHILFFLVIGVLIYRIYFGERMIRALSCLAYPLFWLMNGTYKLFTLPVRLFRQLTKDGSEDADSDCDRDENGG